ncbi:MAG: hypothetical protein CME29_00730 [Gemmatimonadetes bacterium]|nr:hypothetical protein [Gemmatimonadota bacterium]
MQNISWRVKLDRGAVLIFGTMLVVSGCISGSSLEQSKTMEMTTWSVVAVDPLSGDVGVASASCVPSFADALAALVPGKGAAATQASFDIDNRNVVYEAIKEGLNAEQVIARVTDPSVDKETDRRQYGVVTLSDGVVHTAGFTAPSREGTTEGTDGIKRWAGVMAHAGMGVTVQGNTLVNEAVVADGLEAFGWEDPTGFNELSDRLMRALEAGSVAGGDVRCNNETTRQTAAMAFILVARGGDEPYATREIGMSDQGTSTAPWLAISVRGERGGDNPLLELRLKYDQWRRGSDR